MKSANKITQVTIQAFKPGTPITKAPIVPNIKPVDLSSFIGNTLMLELCGGLRLTLIKFQKESNVDLTPLL